MRRRSHPNSQQSEAALQCHAALCRLVYVCVYMCLCAGAHLCGVSQGCTLSMHFTFTNVLTFVLHVTVVFFSFFSLVLFFCFSSYICAEFHLSRLPSSPLTSPFLPLSLSSPPAPPSGTAEGGCAVTACRAPVRLTARSRWPLAYLPLRRPRPSFRRHPAGCPSRLRRGCGKRRTRRRRRRRRRAC